jgi:RecA-family ATPase
LTYARSGGRKAAAGRFGGETVPMPLSELTARPVDWLWPGRIPFGAITVLAGEPGLGKSLLTLDLAARLSRGELSGDAGSTLLLTAEDAREQVVVPRLIAAGADQSRVLVPPRPTDGLDLPLRIPDEMEAMRRLVIAGDVRLLVVDPFSAHLPGHVNGNSDKSVRGALAPLAALAEEQNLAVVLVAHLNKGESAHALHRIGGSIALPAAARSVLLLTRDPDDPEQTQGSLRVLAHVKSNLDRFQPSLAYRIDETNVSAIDEPVPAIRELGPSRYTAEQLLALNQPEARSKREEAQELLKAELADGPKLVRDLHGRAHELGISLTTLNRAKDDLGVASRKRNLGAWEWTLPDSSADQPDAAAA